MTTSLSLVSLYITHPEVNDPLIHIYINSLLFNLLNLLRSYNFHKPPQLLIYGNVHLFTSFVFSVAFSSNKISRWMFKMTNFLRLLPFQTSFPFDFHFLFPSHIFFSSSFLRFCIVDYIFAIEIRDKAIESSNFFTIQFWKKSLFEKI